jgi:hypothetical protein
MALLNAAKELNLLHYGMLQAARSGEMGGGYGSASASAMRNIKAMQRIGKLLGIMTDFSTTPMPFLPARLLTAAKKRMGRRLPVQTLPKLPDTPPPDHTDQTAPRM